MRRFFYGLVAAMLLVLPASAADVAPIVVATSDDGLGVFLEFCDQAATGVCARSGDNVTYAIEGYSRLVLYGLDSTATTYTCDLEESFQGSSWVTVADAQITQAAPVLYVEYMGGHIRVNCSAVSGGDATIRILVQRYS